MICLGMGGSFDVFNHYEHIGRSEPRDWIPFLWFISPEFLGQVSFIKYPVFVYLLGFPDRYFLKVLLFWR